MKRSIAVNNIAIKLVIFGALFILLGNVNLAAAQEPGPSSGEPACTDHGVPTYEEWVKDLPCKPRFQTNGSILEAGPPASLEVRPNGVSGLDSYNQWIFLAYQSYQDDNWEIYANRGIWGYGVDSSDRLTVEPASDISPRVRPGAIQVAFASDRSGSFEIYLTGWGGLNLQQLTYHQSYASQPAWSPDGRRLAFVSEIDGNQEIYLMNPDGSNQKRLTYSAEDDFGPYWSPDGTQIVWVRAVDQYYGMIYVMNADGSNPHPLTSPLLFLEHPAWSPDGLRITFDYDANADGWLDLGMMDADGSYLSPRFLGGYLVDYLAGSWSRAVPEDILLTQVQYVYYGEEYYIVKACVSSIRYSDPYAVPNCLPYSNLDFLPDTAMVDLSIPETHVEALSPFQPAGQFPVTVVGNDPGPAGLTAMLAQFRLGLTGEWQDLGEATYEKKKTYQMNADPGQTIYFRSSGWDQADHQEPWPDTWDTYTQAYSWQLDGSVLDNRGVGIPKAAVSSQPVFSDQIDADVNGSFHRYVPTSPVTVEVSKTGYNTLPKSIIASQADLSYTWVLPPADNLIQNGGLESGLSSWQNSGSYDVHPDERFQHSGTASAEFGWTSSVTETDTLDGGSEGASQPEAVVDPNGTLHITWIGWTGTGGSILYYSHNTITETWTAPLAVSIDGTHSPSKQKMAVGSDGTLHVVWTHFDTGNSRIFAISRSPDGTWSEIVDLSGPVWLNYGGINNYYNLDIAVDSQDTVHVIWVDGNGMNYAYKLNTGGWSSPENIFQEAARIAIAVAGDNTLYLVRVGSDISYTSRSPGGAWSQPVVMSNEIGSGLDAAVDTQGNLHIIWFSYYAGVYYSSVSKSGTVSTPLNISGNEGIDDIALLVKSDRAHVFWRGLNGLKYRSQLTGSFWSPVMKFPETIRNNGASLAAQGDRMFAFWTDGVSPDTEIRFAKWTPPQDFVSSLSQAVMLPLDLHKPTLSFMESITNTGSAGNIEVLVNDQSVFSTSQHRPQWTHQWVDLTPWLGQTITLTFKAENDFSQGFLDAHIDDVSIGSWLTPILEGVAPGDVKAGTPLVLTLTGDNFIDPPGARLNEGAYTGLKFIDEHTLEFSLSSGLKPGIYDVWVANPGGQEALLPAALQVGERIFLPILTSRR